MLLIIQYLKTDLWQSSSADFLKDANLPTYVATTPLYYLRSGSCTVPIFFIHPHGQNRLAWVWVSRILTCELLPRAIGNLIRVRIFGTDDCNSPLNQQTSAAISLRESFVRVGVIRYRPGCHVLVDALPHRAREINFVPRRAEEGTFQATERVDDRDT